MEQQNLRWWIVIFVTVVLGLGYLGLPLPEKWGAGEDGIKFIRDSRVQLGLDLQGGSELRVEFDLSDPKAAPLRDDRQKLIAAVSKAQEILMRRINIFGVKEPRVQVYGETQILIQLPGKEKEEIERVKKILKTSGKLEFMIAADDQTDLDKKSIPGTHVVYPSTTEEKGESGESPLRVLDEVQLEGKDMEEAHAVFGSDGWEIPFKFTPAAGRVFGDLTTKNVDKKLAIVLDGKLVSAPKIIQPITGGSGRITGHFTQKQAQDLATVMKSGSLDAPLKTVGENTVGPALGQDSIRRGLIAGLAAVAGVVLFMLIYYRLLGVIANIAMLANVAIVMGVLAMFGATLTLPGIAGIVLTLGMAVDANILIFERIREEVARGKTALQAFDAAYDRAFLTIIDCHITTLSASIILYYAGTGPIQGFAVTLAVGIVATLATSLWFAKLITRYMILGGTLKEFHMMKLFDKPSFRFARYGRVCFIASLIAIAAGCSVFWVRGKENLSIDFRGGTILNLKFNKKASIEDVRTGIGEIKGPDGVPVYADAEVQSVIHEVEQGEGSEFSIRVSNPDADGLKKALATKFQGQIPLIPIVELEKTKKVGEGGAAQELQIGLTTALGVEDFQKKLVKALEGVAKQQRPLVLSPKSGSSNTFTVAVTPDPGTQLNDVESALKKCDLQKDGFQVADDPFPFVSAIGASVAKDLKSSAAKALLLSWITMILYLTLRFEFSYGIAAVFALIHDVMFSLGFVAVVHWLMPKTWGIDLSLGLSAVAAYLTIVGYSVNDTIVVFDRIRENRKEMKRDPFSVVMDASVNQTLSRTILTSFTVFITVVVLFCMTARSGGGIASFAFPMTIGVIVGTYSSVYIASPIVMWMRGNRPEAG